MKNVFWNILISAAAVIAVSEANSNKKVTAVCAEKGNTATQLLADTTPSLSFMDTVMRSKAKSRFDHVKQGNPKKMQAWASFSPTDLMDIARTPNLDSVRFFLGTMVSSDGNSKKNYPIIMVQLKIANPPLQPGLTATYEYRYYSTKGSAICPPPYNEQTTAVKLEY